MRRLSTGLTDQSIVVHCFDSAEAAVTLTSGSAGLSISYRLDTAGREGTPVSMTPVARLSAGVHRDGAITSKGGGKHEIDLPDAAFASAGYLVVVLSATAVTGRVYSEVIAVGETAELDSADQTEVLDAVTAANAKLDSIALKTALINAGRLRVLSRVAGNVIKAHAGDDHLILAENALTLEVDDDDASLYALLTAGTNQNLKFGAGRASDTDADEISATIPAANVRHVGTSTFVDIELPSAATAGRRGEYEFDIQITNAAGYKITPQQLQGTLMIEVDRKS